MTHAVLAQNQVDKHPTLYCLDELGYSPRQSQSMRLIDKNDVGGLQFKKSKGRKACAIFLFKIAIN